MESVKVIDVLIMAVNGLLGVGFIIMYNAFISMGRDIKESSTLATAEREKAAASLMSEKEKLAALVLSEKEKLAYAVKIEHEKLVDNFNSFRIEIAENYAKTTLVEKILQPILDKLGHIENMLPNKLDRREFDQHKAEIREK